MHRGYVCMWRKSLDSSVFKNANVWYFWSWCLMKASHKKYTAVLEFKEVNIEPGQFIFGRRKAAKELSLSEQEIRTCVRFLEKIKNITQTSTQRFSIISIVNWDIYQGNGTLTNPTCNPSLTQLQPIANHIQTQQPLKNTFFSVETSDIKEEKNIPESPPEDSKPEKPKKPPVPVQKINDLYNEILSENGGLLLSEFPDLVNDKIKARWNMKDTSHFEQNPWEQGKRFNCLEWWESFFEHIYESDWLMGRVKGCDWKADLGWILRKEKFLEILSGKFENKKRF